MAKPLSNRQRKYRLVCRLSDAGIVSDAMVINMMPKQITDLMPDITQSEIQTVFELQNSVRNGSFFEYITTEETEVKPDAE